ncbi:pirin family protein [Shewanella sp. AS16]|uniref:pirin family protein n=1 Tax=Shewanella sp. AS16 TaxID=2907625 RepID=UPI001F176D2A|nr:pirin family protein [Shewanella sp. AS16]MCE9686626.1 pirin family protein [Shewanella sp. AS16]
MINIRRAEQRGKADFGWLKSRHSFSFGQYYDPEQMGFSALRVINDDYVAPGMGFDTHGHKDMEIISYVTQGEIAHKDSYGHEKVLPAGEFQLMSAGKGIYHSEYNASKTDELRFLQIWIQPNEFGQAARYQQQAFEQTGALTAVVTPNGENGTLQIKQDATLYRLRLAAGEQLNYLTTETRNTYVHLISGELTLDGQPLQPGDGARVTEISELRLASRASAVEALVFDLP